MLTDSRSFFWLRYIIRSVHVAAGSQEKFAYERSETRGLLVYVLSLFIPLLVWANGSLLPTQYYTDCSLYLEPWDKSSGNVLGEKTEKLLQLLFGEEECCVIGNLTSTSSTLGYVALLLHGRYYLFCHFDCAMTNNGTFSFAGERACQDCGEIGAVRYLELLLLLAQFLQPVAFFEKGSGQSSAKKYLFSL